MSDQEPMVSDLDHDDLALYNYIKRTENNDIEYEGDSDSGSSIVYDLVQELKPPAANDSIFQNDTLVDEEIDKNTSLTSNRSSLLDDKDNDPDFNVDDYSDEESESEPNIVFSHSTPETHSYSTPETHSHSTQETHRILYGNTVCCKRTLDSDNVPDRNIFDFHSASSDEEENTNDNQSSIVHSQKDKDSGFDHASQKSVDSELAGTSSIVHSQKDKDLCFNHASQKSVDSELAGTSNNEPRETEIKQHVCVYCEKTYTKIVRHYQQMHADEAKVAEALAYPKKSTQRHVIWAELRHKGNFAANKSVMLNKVGTFIPARKPKKSIDVDDYIPCPDCFGVYKKSFLWKHSKKCLSKSESGEANSKRKSTLGKFLIPLPAECGNSFKLEVLSSMKRDRIYFLIVKDPLIIRFGERLYAKYRNEKHQHNLVKQRMRELGRFLQKYIDMNGAASLSDAIHCTKFKYCVASVRDLCGFDNEKGSCVVPSLAIKIGQSLTTCALIKQSDALEAEDKASREAMDEFLTLYKNKWNTEVTSVAHRTLQKNTFNNPKCIPLTKDIQKMNKYIEEKAQEAETHLENAAEDKERTLRTLRELTLAQIVLFNRRRGGEAQRIEVDQVKQGFLAKNLREDVMSTLSKFEQKLANTLERFEIRGKRGRRVPVLLTEPHKRRVNLLLKHHTGGSKYLFFLTEDTTLNTWKILSDVAKECGAEKPELISSTNLRKHISTVSQILNLQEHELDSVADFLGHDIRVHRQFYRLSEDTMQLAKVSKLLIQMESGNLAKHKNKTLDEIQCDEDEEVPIDEEVIEDPVQENAELTETERDVPMEEVDSTNQQAVSDIGEGMEEYDDEPLPKRKRQKKWKAPARRLVWTDEETDAVFTGLAHLIRKRKLPGKTECVTLMRDYPCLHRRNWEHIKYYVKNYLEKELKSAPKS